MAKPSTTKLLILSIVAVHGLDGHWKRSWTADNGCFWLRDLLPSIIPGARIYSFGHNSKTRGSTVPLAYDIPDHGKELVSALSIERQLENTTKAPIFFIGHSLGGLIIKSALLHADTAQVGHLERQKAVKLSTYGLLFLATPHQGGQGVSIAKIITNILSTVTYTNKKLLDRIEPNSEWLQDLQSRYNSISQDFATTYFYETQEMKTPIGSLLVVPKFSAVVFGAVNSESVAMAADHSTIAKFANSQNSDFRKISRILQLFASQAKEAVAWNWKRWEVFRGNRQDRFHKGSEFSASEFKVGIAFHLIRNPQFSGRRGILQRLDYSLRKPSGGINPNIVVLYGSGGVGKTQVALEYAYRSRSKEALDEERRANKSQGSRRLFLSWLSYADNCSWLLVIDNVDDFEGFNLREWLPSTFCGAVIITSRRPELAINWDSIKINQMNSQEALSLLEKSSKIQIDQVPRSKSFLLRLSLMQKTAERPWDIKQDTVLTTWEISFIAIEKRNPLAIQIFSICSFLSPNSIREELFVHQNTIQAQEWQVYEAFTILSSYSFFKQAIHGSSRTFSIHPLIHFWTRIRMDSEQQRQTARRTVSILRDLSLKHIPTSSHAIFLSSLFKKWSPCDNALSNIIPITPVPQEKRIWPVDLRFDTTTLIINTLRLLGREAYDHAAFATHKLLTNGKFESEDWETVDLIPTPDGPEAIKNLEWVLCHATQRFSIKGPRVLGIVSEYASVLLENSQGDGSAARAWYLWLLTTLAEQLGTDNP
ncbi:uncharacterized protein FOBCDRAFT_149100, partial [Fusarium oxysporum Fo47]|uniref:uncharacterized protein n=1 Tax=Fusarium oxysporum Fo47 TaxID=660027 RepID=UPI0028699BB1